MPAISLKGQTMPESPIRKLVPFAERAREKGRKVFHLNIGQPDIETPIQAMEAVRHNHIKVLEYSHSAGFESYRKGLASYYQRCGIDISFEDLIVTTGGSEAILFAMNSITDPGDEIIIPEPFYANYNGFGISSGVNVVPITSRIEDNFALPPIAEFEALITDRTKAIMICNPGNPTGYLYTREELEELARLVKKYDLFLLADEVYREFAYDGAQHHSILNLPGLEENAIMIDSVSKRYSMCGARIGCLVSRNVEVMATALKYAQARLSPPTLAQIASEAALETGPEYFEAVKKEYTQRRDILVEGLNSIEGVTCPKPRGAFYAMAQLPVDNAERFAQWLLSTFELDNQTVMLAPAEGFYATPGMGLNQVRLAYVLNVEALKKSVDILKEALKQYPGSLL
jgi:aspartate aminotransferase